MTLGTEMLGPEQRLRPDDELWDGVARLIDRYRDNVDGLALHGLAALAAELLEARSAAVPEMLRPYLERTRVMALAARFILGRVRDVSDGPILLFKGPEAAARYPHAARGYGDLDLLVPAAPAVQRQLRRGGFDELPDPEGVWVGIHHLPPLRWRGSLYVEVHSAPHWPEELCAPSIDELVDAAVPSEAGREAGVDGILAPHPAHHALLLAAHAWAHQPLGRARDLVDVGAFRAEADAAEIRATARRWGISRLWQTTDRAIDGLLNGHSPLPFRLWAGHIPDLREKTVVEDHVERVCSPMWGYPARTAARRTGRALLAEVRPAGDEGWGEKLRRSFTALRRPFLPLAEHRRLLGPAANRWRNARPTEPHIKPDKPPRT
jgi:hypothetical protein